MFVISFISHSLLYSHLNVLCGLKGKCGFPDISGPKVTLGIGSNSSSLRIGERILDVLCCEAI